ncbi:MAG TPA: HU family DNA-binding protein [Gemmatimonadaceae bacterium]|nr:HU family DNA-binding protein [Gemmatimonadaceae bacterium]
MNKAELLSTIQKRTGVAPRDVKAVVDAIFNPGEGIIAKSIKKGDKVVLTGFGSFERRARGARKARNPQTGEAIKVKARKVPAFRAGAALKEAVK